MLRKLRSRLLFSYGFVIVITLLIVGLALFGFATLSGTRFTQPLQRLASIATSTRFELVRVVQRGGNLEDVEQILAQTAVEQNVRILIANNNTQQVVYDSDPGQGWIGVAIDDVNSPSRLFVAQSAVVYGLFQHPNTGANWLVYGLPLTGTNRVIIIYAQPAPTPMSFFREFFVRPLCSAGLIALLLSILLALGISRSVARPLQGLADAAEAVSAGDYGQPVHPAGPEEVRRVAASFNSMAERVQMTQQAQRDFVANVSHDLKTPITSITGWSQALIDGTADTETAQQHAAGVIHNEAERMARMVTHLLDLARVESGQFDLAREAVDLQQLLTQVHQNAAPRAQERGIHLTEALQPVPPISGDPDRLMQVFANLVDNAMTHTERDGRIHLALKPYGTGAVEASVQDTGRGIPTADLSRIFERFYQVDKSRVRQQKRGSGLGLTIARELIEAHGGRIQAHSEMGKGTLMVVRLPVTPDPEVSTVISER